MRFSVTMKTPDACEDVVKEESLRYQEHLRENGLDDEEEIEARVDEFEHEMQATIEKWFRHGEYLTVTLDTEGQTCTVVKP